jgi:hypothetical protein
VRWSGNGNGNINLTEIFIISVKVMPNKKEAVVSPLRKFIETVLRHKPSGSPVKSVTRSVKGKSKSKGN